MKRILIPLLIILLLLSIVVMGAPTYVNIGPTTEFEGDIGVPAGSGYHIGDIELDINWMTSGWTLTHLEDTLFFGAFSNIYYVKYGNLDATSAPTVNDDVDLDYMIGSRWIDVTADKEYICLDNTNGAAVWTETTGAGGGASTFLGLTDTPAVYTDQAGKYTKVNAGETALEFGTPAGAGDMLQATYDADADGDIDVAAGGTEKSSWTLYAIPYLSGTTTFGEITIGTAEYCLTVNAGANGYDWTLFDLSLYYLKTEVDTQGEMETIWGDTLMNDLVDDPAPELGGEMDAGAHSIGFTQQTVTYNVTTTTVDWTAGNKAAVTLTGNVGTFAFTNPTNPCNVLLKIVQDGTGSRLVTAWDADIKWAGGGTAPTLSTAANSIDIISFYFDGSAFYGVASLDFQ